MQGRFENLSDHLQDSHVPLLVFDLQKEANRVLVRRSMRVSELRELLIARFIAGANSASEYAVYYEGKPLVLTETLAAIPPGAQIRLERSQRQHEIDDSLILVFDRTTHYVIERLPLVIGRSKQGQSVDLNLIDLPDGATVSRRHAMILQQGKSYYVQNLTENIDRSLHVNETPVSPGMMKELTDGAVLRLGKVTLTVRVRPKRERG